MEFDRNLRIFLSHSSNDKTFVRSLDAAFLSVNVETFLDEREVKVGESIPEKIYEGIDDATHLCFVISSNSVDSNWVDEEIGIAKMKQKKNGTPKILPILIEDVELPTSVMHIKYADFRNWKNSDSFRESFLALLPALGLKAQMLGAYELRWYAANASILRDHIQWLTRSTYEISGGLDSSLHVEGAHYMPTKWAFEENRILTDLHALMAVIPHNNATPRLQAISSQLRKVIKYVDEKLSSRTYYHDWDRVNEFKKLLETLITMLGQLRTETELAMIAGIDLKDFEYCNTHYYYSAVFLESAATFFRTRAAEPENEQERKTLIENTRIYQEVAQLIQDDLKESPCSAKYSEAAGAMLEKVVEIFRATASSNKNPDEVKRRMDDLAKAYERIAKDVVKDPLARV